jgi:diguanylate cyclase (GGDEF)-like protein
MRLINRNDLFLLIGVSIALFAIVSRPLGRVLAYAYEVDESRGQQLLPGVVILAVVFVFHQARKRHEVWAEALASAAAARQATARAAEMARLVGFGQALGESLDHDSIRDVAARHLPTLAGGRPAWAMLRSGQDWRPLGVMGDLSLAECERAARRALGEASVVVDGERDDACFPMIVAGEPIGVLGVSPDPPLADYERIVLSTAAALLAASLKNAELFQVVHENSVRDALTGCFNRKHAMEVIDDELRRSRRSHLPLSLIMCDLDHFKQVNDRFGHLCGDAVLAAVGQRMHAVLRGSDLKCRYGGEEFLILLPDTTLSGACRAGELLRSKIEEHPVRWNEHDVRVTASFGLTEVTPGELDVTAIIGRADAALYRAKENGLNCVCRADEHEAIALSTGPPASRGSRCVSSGERRTSRFASHSKRFLPRSSAASATPSREG